jgi:hypothetical protein
MPNDAKFGLIIGVTVVIAISVVFFRKEPGRWPPRGREAAAAAVGSNVPAAPTHNARGPVPGETAAEQGRAR